MANIRHLPKLITALLISLLLCIPAALAVFYYTQPMEDLSFDLSLLPEDGQEWEGNKGWSVYTDHKGEKRQLTSDGSGGYSGLSYPGQTFYYSREMSEKLDSPVLQIGVVNRTVSVFLDNTLIYTDCPELDNRIGYLELPMLDSDRSEPVTVSLPPNYEGRTLTVAQSSPGPGASEKQGGDDTVYPCEITLYCGYSYESGLIAETARVMIPAVLLFALVFFLLAAFIWNTSFGTLRFTLPFFALTVFFQMCSVLAQTDFFYQYFGSPSSDPTRIFFDLSVASLLAFLTIYAKPLRILFLIITVLQFLSTIAAVVVAHFGILLFEDTHRFITVLPHITGFVALFAVLVCSFFLNRKNNRFFRHLFHTALVIIIGYTLFLLLSIPLLPDYADTVLTRIAREIAFLFPNYSLKLLWNLCLLSSLSAVVIELAERETRRRTEHIILAAKSELALQSYENLRRQSEEVQMLRHDMMKHYSLLGRMAAESPEKLADYLSELTGLAEQVRPVVSSGNQILDIIINGKLNTASDKGITAEIIRSEAPKILPLTDTDTCCLFLNILENAVNAASDPGIVNPFLRLDFHCKNRHFIFSCENSVLPESEKHKKNPMPGHGYGMEIIRSVMGKWGNMVSVERTKTKFKITIIIPLPQNSV
ncbi:GHKL domain-containing protein [Ruminococcus sp. OA3]|uniref:GHKL domain-containing protein n=1 Tax=Ruminococcus sp. OA3 TaxID=2914164 RepID=UPI001F053C6B|nr:GHKL domain-containing protein [Ruminococcus sp. OA3]MCH1983273.1 GHKL domain-containing protein [Ruminococcus sp. OA3]